MEVLHQAEQPSPLVPASLLEALHHADALHRVADAVALDTCMGEFALTWVEPPRCERRVGKHEEAEDGYSGCGCALTVAVSVPCKHGKGGGVGVRDRRRVGKEEGKKTRT